MFELCHVFSAPRLRSDVRRGENRESDMKTEGREHVVCACILDLVAMGGWVGVGGWGCRQRANIIAMLKCSAGSRTHDRLFTRLKSDYLSLTICSLLETLDGFYDKVCGTETHKRRKPDLFKLENNDDNHIILRFKGLTLISISSVT